MSTDTDRLEKEAEKHRSNLDSTFDAIRDRLSVGQIVDEVSGYLREGAGAETAQNLGRQVRDNPLALGLVGAGIAWLFMGSGVRAKGHEYADDLRARRDDWRRDSSGNAFSPDSGPHYTDDRFATPTSEGRVPVTEGRYTGTSGGYSGSGSSGPGLGSRASNAAHSAGSSVSDAASRAGSSASHAASSAGSSISGAASSVGSSASNAAGSARDAASRGLHGASDAMSNASDAASRGLHDARDAMGDAAQAGYDNARYAGRAVYRGGYRAGRGVANFLHDEPLVFGAIALAVGAAVGAMLPPTRQEDEWLGETRDHLRDEAYAQGRDTLDRAGNVATKAYEAASDEAENKGLKPTDDNGSETLAKKVADVGRAAESAAKDEADKQGLGTTSRSTDASKT